MMNSKYLVLATLVSFSSFGAVSFQEKQNRVVELMKMQSQVPAIAFEAYQRELSYERKGLTIEARAKNESNLLAEKVRAQVLTAYQAALLDHESPEMARQEVREAVVRDLEFASPEMREEIKSLALHTLENAESGEVNQPVNLSSVEEAVTKEIVSRKNFLNAEYGLFSPTAIDPVANPSKDSEKKDYSLKTELMESLVSERDSSRWVSSSSQTAKTSQVRKVDGKLSFQVKMEFLGVALEAGPTILFKREVVTSASILSEGMNPLMLRGGKFDRYKRDANNKILIKNGKPVLRYAAFWCDSDLKFDSEYTGSGGFSYMGLGGGTSISKTFSNSVNIQSRRVALPESVENKIMDVEYLSSLCHDSFLKAKISNSMTVRQSLEMMMKNILGGLVFSSPKTKCAVDNQCRDWWEKEVPAIQKQNNTYRCVEHAADKYRFCQVRGLQKQLCPVIENGRRVSPGTAEFPCDWKFKCVKKSNASFIGSMPVAYAKGVCE